MQVNPDFRDLFAELNTAGAEFLVVGAYAVMAYTEPRFTKDLDVWVRPSPANAVRVHAALDAFGAGLAGLAVVDADLGQALDTAATSVRNGDGTRAASVLQAHVARAEARVEWRTSGTLRRRTQVVSRLAQALGTLAAGADWGARREAGLVLGHVSLRL